MIKDFPKILSPFKREIINGEYIVTPIVEEGMEWVFTDPEVICSEKLHGTNVSVVIENGIITSIWNRTQRIPFFNKGKMHIVEGVMHAFERGYCELPDGQYFGECLGPKINGNLYKLEKHLWIPFDRIRESLRYKSWGKYPKDYATISAWFEHDLQPLYNWKLHTKQKCDADPKFAFVEGVVFYQPSTGKMAKLRKDQFAWWKEKRHKQNDEEM